MLPPFTGAPIRVEVRRLGNAHLAATSIPGRVIYLDAEVLARQGEFERILVHELFHFVWVRLGNPARHSWERVLEGEVMRGERGELGWSAEWRKCKLPAAAARERSPAWRHYVCESFCDTGAWMFAGLAEHDEFTLTMRSRRGRRAWFESRFERAALRI